VSNNKRKSPYTAPIC